MTTAIDTNIIVALWNRDDPFNRAASEALVGALRDGALLIAAPVFAELVGAPGRDEGFVDRFLSDTGITVDWNLEEAVWRRAGRAFQSYAARRRKRSGSAPRRILTDFLIGAHALDRGYRLLTMDEGLYRSAFPALKIVKV